MSTQVRLRRGTTVAHSTFTGALAEVTVDTDKKTVVVHDGGTVGGIPLSREDSKNDGALGYQQDVKTNNYTVLVTDIGKMLVGDKATAINFQLSPAATLTSKFVAGFKNINAGPMTVTPNGAELIDGVNAAITIPTGASVVIKGDGASFRTFFSNGDVTGNAINNAPALTGANLADGDKLGVFDVSAPGLVSILVSELVAGIFKTARKIANAYFLSSFRLWDATDNTKGIAFALNGLTTGQTRTITMPDRDVTLGGPVLGTATASTSGTQIDRTGIPSWANRVTVMLDGLSTSGVSGLALQIGDSGGISATGYASGVAAILGANSTGITSATNAFLVGSSTVAASVYTGKLVLERIDGNTWVCVSKVFATGSGIMFEQGGSKTLTGALDRVRLTAGGDSFDAGKVNVSWE